MSWQVRWADRALKDAERLDRQVKARILQAIDRLAKTGHGDVKRLAGTDREYRLRVGSWRVILTFDHPGHAITIQHVLARGRAYRS